jgi:hypothetical protein
MYSIEGETEYLRACIAANPVTSGEGLEDEGRNTYA